MFASENILLGKFSHAEISAPKPDDTDKPTNFWGEKSSLRKPDDTDKLTN